MSSTAALEYNTNGELTIKNRQNESTGNSLKFRTSASESNKLNSIIDISQNNNSRLRIDDKGPGSIIIEGDYKSFDDKISNIRLTTTDEYQDTGDVKSSLYLSPNNISLKSNSYYKDGPTEALNNYISLNYGYDDPKSKIVIQNNDYKIIYDDVSKSNKYDNQSISNITLDKNSIKLSRYPKASDTSSNFIDINSNGIEINSNDKNIILTNNNIRIESGLIDNKQCLKINQVGSSNSLMYQGDTLYIKNLNLNGNLIDSILTSSETTNNNNELITLGYANKVFAPLSTVPGIQNYPILMGNKINDNKYDGKVIDNVSNFPTEFNSYSQYELFRGQRSKVENLWFERGRTFYNISFTLNISAGETTPPSFDDIKRFVANLKLMLVFGSGYYPINSTFKIDSGTSEITLYNNCSFVSDGVPNAIINFIIYGINCSSDISNVNIALPEVTDVNPRNCLIQSFGIQI